MFVNTLLGGGDNVQSYPLFFELESDKSSAHENSHDKLEASRRLLLIKGTFTFLVTIPFLRIASFIKELVSINLFLCHGSRSAELA